MLFLFLANWLFSVIHLKYHRIIRICIKFQTFLLVEISNILYIYFVKVIIYIKLNRKKKNKIMIIIHSLGILINSEKLNINKMKRLNLSVLKMFFLY